MGQDFTTTALVADVRRRAHLGTATTTGSDTTALLAMATQELQGRVAQMIMSVSEEYFVAYEDVAIVAGTTRYRIPARAMLGKLRELYTVDSAGTVISQLEQSAPETLGDVSGDFYVEGEHVVLTGEVSGAYLRMVYFRRPSALVATSAVAVVSSVNAGTDTITTVATIPGTFSTSTPLDIVRAKPGFGCLAVDQTATVATGTTITLNTDLPSDIAAGDYICLAGEAPVAQIAPELHQILSQATACAWLEAQNDQSGLQAAVAKLQALEKSCLQQLESRVEGAPRKFAYVNPLFSGVRQGWW